MGLDLVTPRIATDSVTAQALFRVAFSPSPQQSSLTHDVAFLPYTIGTGLTELNQALLQANAVPLDDAYKATFNVSIADTAVDPLSS